MLSLIHKYPAIRKLRLYRREGFLTRLKSCPPVY
jgi:hypothetical protein